MGLPKVIEQESQIAAHTSCLQNLPLTGRCGWGAQLGPNSGILSARDLGFYLDALGSHQKWLNFEMT